MRVLHVISAVAPRYGGPSQAVLGMCRALRARADTSVLLATTDGDGPTRLPVERLGTQIVYGEVPAIFFRRAWRDSFHFSLPAARWLRAHVADFDVVHIHGVFGHPGIVAAHACAARGVPYIVRPLGTLDPWSLRQKSVRKQLAWRVLRVGAMLRDAAAIQYTAIGEQRNAEDSLHLSNGVVVPLGIDEAVATDVGARAREAFRQQLGIGTDEPYVLVLCRLHTKKRLELLMQAFLDAVAGDADVRRWRLVIAGDGEPAYVGSLKRLAAELPDGGKRIVFAGWLAGPDKAAAVQGAAAMALPSLQENFGIALVEALACGVPVVVSPNVNLAQEIEEVGAGWVTPLNRQSLARTLVHVLGNDDERFDRGQKGRALAQTRFLWPRVAEQLSQLYSTVQHAPAA